jgi:hypothetical protein
MRLRDHDRYYDLLHEQLSRETGMPNPMIRGEIGASAAAYPNGLLSQRIGRWLMRQLRRVSRREVSKLS